MNTPRCSCPYATKDGHLQRVGLDAKCPAHGPKVVRPPAQRVHQNCKTCTCREPDPANESDEI